MLVVLVLVLVLVLVVLVVGGVGWCQVGWSQRGRVAQR